MKLGSVISDQIITIHTIPWEDTSFLETQTISDLSGVTRIQAHCLQVQYRKWGSRGPSGRLASAKLVIHVKYGIFIYFNLLIND